jgi:DNA ligase-1
VTRSWEIGGEKQEVVYHVFHCISLKEFESNVSVGSAMGSRELLHSNVIENACCSVLPMQLIKNQTELDEYYNAAVAGGFEGIMVKDPTAPYQFKRSTNWMKLKPTKSVEGTIKGMLPGTGKYEGMLGALMVDIGGVITDVGSGFSDNEREIFWKDRDSLLGKQVTVVFQEFTADGKLRFPRFKGIRPRGF